MSFDCLLIAFSNIHGHLHNRFCRLASEKAYYLQAMTLCSSYTNGTSNNTVPVSSTVSTSGSGSCSTNNSNSGVLNNNVGSNGLSSSNNGGNCFNQPNCYLMVMMSEASSVFIRLMHPISLNKCDKAKNHLVCHSHTCNSHMIPMDVHNDEDGDIINNNHLSDIVHNDGIISTNGVSPAYVDQKLVLHRKHFKVDSPIRHWYDYLTVHLSWTLGYVPHNIFSRIRPVFLYRTVRRCINSLTKEALVRRQQELVDTGDTQPEEVIYIFVFDEMYTISICYVCLQKNERSNCKFVDY